MKKIIFLVFLFLLFRIPALGRDISNTDALRWHNRSQDFLQALKGSDFKSMYQHYQPGVTLMWLNAVVKQASFSYQHKVLRIEEPKTLEHADFFPVIDGISRAAVVLVLALLLVFQFFFLRKLFNEKVSIYFALLMSVEPYLIGIDRWFHLTSLETYFAFSSLLALLLWKKEMTKKYLVFSAILFSFSVLSKLTTMITIPVYLIIFVFKYFEIKKKSVSYNLILFAFISLFTFALFFPAFLTAPVYVFQKLFNAATSAVGENYRNEQLTSFNRIFFYDLILLLKLSPITVLLFIFGIFKSKKIFKDFSLILVIFNILTYYVFLSLAEQKIDRYAIVMFPSILLICSIYLTEAREMYQKVIVAASVLFVLLMSIMYYPVYSAYNSPLLGGTAGAIRLKLYDNSGEYFAQAAFYLNQKGREIKTYVPNGYASFEPFYWGKTVGSVEESNYLVTSLDLTRPALESFGCDAEEKSFGGRGDKKVVFVFKCNNYSIN